MERPWSKEEQPPLVYVSEAAAWEYRVLTTKKPPTEDELNTIGKEGWELVSVMADGKQTVSYFKRLQ